MSNVKWKPIWKRFILLSSVLGILMLSACTAGTDMNATTPEESTTAFSTAASTEMQPENTEPTQDTQDDGMIAIEIEIEIEIGMTSFPAKLFDTETTRFLVAQFPMTVQMQDVNRNEKAYWLPQIPPAGVSERAGTIQAGDLMLWSGSCLVLFYETFSSSYSYVRLGYIEDPTGLKTALGSGDVAITFYVK